MNDRNIGMSRRLLAAILACWTFHFAACGAAENALLAGWQNPPRDARLRAYWWWLNGNVTSNAITRDLEEMKAKGFGGALICDADGSSQDGNVRAKHGPTFFSPEWRALYRHALHEADRLGLEMSLNIQSGWNLGGPMVTPDDAPKKLVWTEIRVTGATNFSAQLAKPRARDDYYRDLFVLAYLQRNPVPAPWGRATVTASSWQPGHPPELALDGNTGTFWVSAGDRDGQGPTAAKPEWLQLHLDERTESLLLQIGGRPGYGPRKGELQISVDGQSFQREREFTLADGEVGSFTLRTNAPIVRIVITEAYDRGSPSSPRNVQVSELALYLKDHPLGVPPVERQRLQNWEQKALLKPLTPFSAPDSAPVFQEFPARDGEEDTRTGDVLDLTARLDSDGALRWDVPPGDWEILRLGCTLNDHCRVSTCSEGWEGYALDPFDAGAFSRYWDAVVEPLIADAGPFAGTALKYLHTDSWEVEVANWTPALREEFRKRRGYELLPWLPVIAGKIVNSREESNRFLHDFRKTFGDLAMDNHYKLFKDGAHKHGLLIHPESGGPHAVPIDAQRCLGFNDAPMSEFWAWSWRHRVGDRNRFFVKQPASAAHTYGRKLVLAEGFTTIGPHWQETLWDNLKPSFDKALCEGLNLLVWHAFVCSPEEEGLPGIQYFAGTHLNPNVTWWTKSKPFFDYLNRCQFMLQQGLFVADVAYYHGDHVPNFAQLKSSDPAKILPGYDYDVVTEEVLLTRMAVRDGRLVLPDGMSYRVLVLRDLGTASLPVLRKLKEFVAAGATVIGVRPTMPSTLTDYPKCNEEFAALVNGLWGEEKSEGQKGRIIADKTTREVLVTDGVAPDFEFAPAPGLQSATDVDYIHRRDGGTDIYFVANRSTNAISLGCTFRVAAKAPELWNAVTGERQFAVAYSQHTGRTTVPLDFPPCGSWFVVFRAPAAEHPATARNNARSFELAQELGGPWTAHFPRGMSAGERDDREMLSSATRSVVFDPLTSWTTRPEPGIRFYAGAATYTKTFEWNPEVQHANADVWLDLGDLRELAEVRLNGRPCGIVWSPPFRVNISGAVKPGTNQVAVEVVNFWPNRIIGDASLPPEKRFTKTNIRKLTKDTALTPSGLFGPATLFTTQETGR